MGLMRRTIHAIAAVAFTSLWALPTAARGEEAGGTAAADVVRWVAQLDDDAFAARQRAMFRLIDAGRPAIRPVAQAIARGNPEVGWRGIVVLRNQMGSENVQASLEAEKALHELAASDRQGLAQMAAVAIDYERKHRHPLAVSRLRQLGGEVDDNYGSSGETTTSVTLTADWQGNDDGLWNLRRVSNLHSLRVDGAAITDKGLQNIARLTSLRTLRLANTEVTDEGLRVFGSLPNLRELQVTGGRITDRGLAHLAELVHLETLDLRRTGITDEGLRHLARLTAVRGLELRETRISDAGLVHLKPLAVLKWLSLENTRVTDAGLMHLTGHKHLARLYFKQTRVSSAGVARFLSAQVEGANKPSLLLQ